MKPTLIVITGEGEDISRLLEDRLLSLEITDEAGVVADSFRMVLDDRGNAIAMPASDVTLQMWLGYEGGLFHDMGSYTVDEVELSDAPQTITISGKSSNMVASLKSWKKRSWDKKLNPKGTLGGIIRTIALEHKLEPAIAKEYEDIKIDHLDQTYESDMNLLTRMAEQYGAVCKPAGGKLLFVRRGACMDANGEPLPVVVLAKLLTILCSPVAAWLSLGRDALPKWLRWMQTHDNPIDALWQQPEHMRGYATLAGVQPIWCAAAPLLRWYARMLWLMRNPGYGQSNYFGYETEGEEPRVLAQRGTWDSDTTNWLVLRWRGAFQVRAQIFYPFAPSNYLRIYIGWKSTDGKPRLMYAGHINPFRVWKAR